MKSKATIALSLLIIFLTAVASIGGLFIHHLYRDHTNFVLSAWYANDLVTLIVAFPLLSGALFFKYKGSERSHLVWLGMIYFILYNFAYYLFGAAFNWFFPIYVALFTLAGFTLIFGMIETDIKKIESRIGTRSYRMASIYMFFWTFILSIAWIGQWLNFVLTDTLPQLIVQTGGPSNLVAALDLCFVVPLALLSGVWLWQSRPWGYVLAIISNVKGTVYTIVLITGSIIQERSGVEGAMDLIGLWIFLFLGCLLSSMYLLRKYSASVGN